MMPGDPALLIQTEDQPGVLFQLTKVIASHQANITYIDIVEKAHESASVYLELQDVADLQSLVRELQALPVVRGIEQPEPFLKIYGKRVIIMGGGAQVGQVALGAISAGVRAIPIGHTHGQQVLSRLHDEIHALTEHFAEADLETAGGFCPTYETLCDTQTHLYTRLFRS